MEHSKSFFVEGLKVYETVNRWAVQTPENAELEKSGVFRVFGDTLHSTKDLAIEYAKLLAKQEKSKAERLRLEKERLEAEKREKDAIKADTINGFLAGMTPIKAGKARKNLNTLVKFHDSIKTIRERIEEWNEKGTLSIRIVEEPKYKKLPDTYGLSSLQIQNIKRKASETKTVYLVNETELGKTAYEYAKYLINLKG